MGLEVINPGMLTTVQDLGRKGSAAQGCREAGASDAYAFKLGNLILGNDPNAPGLEMTFQGASFCATGACAAVVTGAEMTIQKNGENLKVYEPFLLKTGDVLEIGSAKAGLRGYLLVAGGIQVPSVLGSASTDLTVGIGGYQGRALQKGDLLEIPQKDKITTLVVPKELLCVERRVRISGSARIPVLRFVAGPQQDRFSQECYQLLERQIYRIETDSNRMGIRLGGEALPLSGTSDILSDGIVAGSIQITSQGLPIVMMADHQTTGGYAKIGTVISGDLSVLAQCRPGERIAFSEITVEEANRLARIEYRKLKRVESIVKRSTFHEYHRFKL